MLTDPKLFVQKFWERMAKVRSTPTSRHDKRKDFVHRDFSTCAYIFVRIERVRKPLEHPYEGSYNVAERISGNVFKLEIVGKHVNISFDRIQPVHFEYTANSATQSSPANQQGHQHLRTYICWFKVEIRENRLFKFPSLPNQTSKLFRKE